MILQFPHPFKGALSFAFDDGRVDHVKRAFPLLEQYGFPGSFYVIPGFTKDEESIALYRSQHAPFDLKLTHPVAGWNAWKLISSRGHDIENHSWSHDPLLAKVKPESEKAKLEICESWRAILEGAGRAPLSWAWPYYTVMGHLKPMVQLKHFIRPWANKFSFGDGISPERAAKWADKCIEYKTWFIIITHGLTKQALPAFEALLKRCSELREELWVDTVASVGTYLARQGYDADEDAEQRARGASDGTRPAW